MEETKAEISKVEVFPPIESEETDALTDDEIQDENPVESEAKPDDMDQDLEAPLEDADDLNSDEDDLIITFEGDAPDPAEEEAQEAPSWVKELRKKHRESEREKKKLEKELADIKSQLEPKLEPLPDKPKFEDFSYDEDKFDAALQEWHAKKLKHDANQQVEREKAEAVQKQFDERREAYHVRKSEISKKVPDMQESEELVVAMFDETKQGILLTASDDPAQLIYALGKNPKKLQDLASIDDPIRFAAEAAKLEARMKVTKRTPKATPERKVQGNGSASSAENHLERLREEAEKTGDYSKVVAYKRQRSQQTA